MDGEYYFEKTCLQHWRKILLNQDSSIWLRLADNCTRLFLSSLLMVVYLQLYLEAPWHRLRTGHVWSAGSTSSHSGWRWVNPLNHFLFCLFSDFRCIFTAIDGTTEGSFPTHFLTSASSLCFLLSEAMAFSCFTELMKRMNQNFPHGGAMDTHFANMRSLIQVTKHQ